MFPAKNLGSSLESPGVAQCICEVELQDGNKTAETKDNERLFSAELKEEWSMSQTALSISFTLRHCHASRSSKRSTAVNKLHNVENALHRLRRQRKVLWELLTSWRIYDTSSRFLVAWPRQFRLHTATRHWSAIQYSSEVPDCTAGDCQDHWSLSEFHYAGASLRPTFPSLRMYRVSMCYQAS